MGDVEWRIRGVQRQNQTWVLSRTHWRYVEFGSQHWAQQWSPQLLLNKSLVKQFISSPKDTRSSFFALSDRTDLSLGHMKCMGGTKLFLLLLPSRLLTSLCCIFLMTVFIQGLWPGVHEGVAFRQTVMQNPWQFGDKNNRLDFRHAKSRSKCGCS